MKIIKRPMFLSKESLDLIEKDINAKDSYTVFSNKEDGTVEVELTFAVLEEFIISEEVLEVIIEGLLPALGEAELRVKNEQVKNHLRSLGLTT